MINYVCFGYVECNCRCCNRLFSCSSVVKHVGCCVIVIWQAAAVDALPAFFIEYYTATSGTVDTHMRGKLEIATVYVLHVSSYALTAAMITILP